MQSSNLLSVLIPAAACVLLVGALDYTDLETMGVNCPEMVSCIAITSNNFTSRNCECDRDCSLFNDCCIDATTRLSSRNSRRSNPPSCMAYGGYPNLGAYVVTTCSRSFSGSPEVQRKCQNQNNVSDPLMAVPVTDASTRITYRNRYCAECNNAGPTTLKSWLIQMDCDFNSVNVSNSFIWDNLVYSPELNKWGVFMAATDFHQCDLQFDLPPYLENKVRKCRANVITTCARNWSRMAVKRACESYTAIMYGNNDKVFRNPHCALCNHISVDRMSCNVGISGRKKKPFSFALLLDVNQSDGDQVGVSRPRGEVCGSNQKYDPYFKKCRNLVCALPGYTMVNGKCQKPG